MGRRSSTWSKYEAALLIRAHRMTGAKEFLAAMLDGSAHILGANQIGMSFTIGLDIVAARAVARGFNCGWRSDAD